MQWVVCSLDAQLIVQSCTEFPEEIIGKRALTEFLEEYTGKRAVRSLQVK